MKLETIIANKITNESIYVSFPLTRRELREKLKKINATPDNFRVCGVKTGNNEFGKAVIHCSSLDILNYLGYWVSQFTEIEYFLFFEYIDAGMAWGQDIDDYINMAANIKSFFRIDNVKDYYSLGQWCLNEYLSKHEELSIEDFDTSYEEVEILGMNYASDRLGRFFNNSFYGCRSSFELIYTNEEDIPKHLLVSSLRIKTKAPIPAFSSFITSFQSFICGMKRASCGYFSAKSLAALSLSIASTHLLGYLLLR